MWPFYRKPWEKLGKASVSEVCRIIINARLSPDSLFLKDRDFRGLPTNEFEQIMFDCWFPRDYKAWTAEIWDCDNWTVQCMAKMQARWVKIAKCKQALLFGYISADIGYIDPKTGKPVYHAFIWMVDDKDTMHFYEPQTGRKMSPEFKHVSLVES